MNRKLSKDETINDAAVFIRTKRVSFFPKYLCILVCCFYLSNLLAQEAVIAGSIFTADSTLCEWPIVALKGTKFSTEPGADGRFVLRRIPYGTYTIVGLALGMNPTEQTLLVNKPNIEVQLTMLPLPDKQLDDVVVMQSQEKKLGIIRVQSVRNFTMFEGKKNEVVLLKNIVANTATNNARQVYGGITGLNIWESDGAGLQLGIGGRGLSPNRTSNFNTRQNGYDISADALGYPESYYTPPTEALERIEIIRGASGLQYGTQFGGTVNFIFKKGATDKAFEYVGRQTFGSWNFINSFNSIGGTIANKKLNYYAFYQRKQGDGWRPNSGFDVNNAFLGTTYQVSSKTSLSLEYTHSNYTAQQPGGLTDALFDADAKQSVRNRNWFKVNWNLMAISLTHKFTSATQLNIRNFGLLARRQSLGNLERINVADFNQRRTLIDGKFENIGSEMRLVHRYKAGNTLNTLLAGVRLYAGHTTAIQGDADSLTGPNFEYINPENVEGSNYQFPNYNIAIFAEHIFSISEKLSITPGIRFENIQTYSEGYYRQRVFDFAGNIIVDKRIDENLNRKRSFVIAGVGLSFKPSKFAELYANISQNYRAINFTDLRIQNPNFIIDSNITDEKGFTADIGWRGSVANLLSYELTGFYLYYNNRIGQILRADQPPLYIDYRYRTNVAASRNVGIEAFGQLNIARLLKSFKQNTDWLLFVNLSLINARYINSKDPSIENKKVEMVPPFILRSGMSYATGNLKAGISINYVAAHFSDATNAIRTATAVEGTIPNYFVADFTASYLITKWITSSFSCNNLFDEKYFTRRAESYPGPGIIPSDGRSFFLTLEFNFGK